MWRYLEVQPISQHLKISIFYLLHKLAKIEKSSLEQDSDIPVLNICVNWEKSKYNLTPKLENLNF